MKKKSKKDSKKRCEAGKISTKELKAFEKAVVGLFTSGPEELKKYVDKYL